MKMEDLVNYCKQYGFVFPGSEIYGGFANTWDFGPVGVELKNNIKKAWWKRFVQEDMNTYGVDAAILMNPRVWEASGHVSSFSDPKMDCKKCKQRFRADNLIEEFNPEISAEQIYLDNSFRDMKIESLEAKDNRLTIKLSGKPVIKAIDEPGSLVERINCGFQTEAENAKQVADAILKFASMTDVERTEMGMRGKRYAEDNLEWSILAKRFLEPFK